jgi:antitoxin Xre/MbcA/ParS-like protein
MAPGRKIVSRQNASSAVAYPATLYAPPALPDLSSSEERRRLSPAALRAFFNIMEKWSVRDEDARQLLGGVSNGKYYQLKQNPQHTLDQDRLQRISYLIGIFKALNILYSTKLADQWIQLANTNPLFTGRTPLAYMLHGGTPAMEIIRRLLDARRGG